ncbi:MAG: hypothetical protein KF909_13335 [Rhodocyclaceae bacterium]|nr:hypothetical protein [Rhodocyclaceae bacterium]MCP5240427.1 hypothetical protein [Zoogloeaceae bacterium]MCB1911779.1 hypothetical protein [Rhodocyclaceae bacterium]MCP5253464.1 hypothetical protein [Zoogloeaceae bacterium]MCP5295542.1 hypothetical protein [Zoogloeaceae bacterium]
MFVLLLSREANDSAFVRREVERAASKGKPVLPVRLEEVTPSRALELFISSEQWIDAWRTPREPHWRRLAEVIVGLGAADAATPSRSATPAPPAAKRSLPAIASKRIVPALVALLLAVAGLGGWLSLRDGGTPQAMPAPAAVQSGAAEPARNEASAAPPEPAPVPAPASPPLLPATDSSGAAGPCPQRLSINPDLPMPFSCECTAEAVREGTVWGTDAYTNDSALCRAARHAGVIPADGGRITALRETGHDLYVGTSRNGVTTSDYGPYTPSVRFAGGPPPRSGPGPCPQRLSINAGLPMPFTCICAAEAVREGTVWGSNVYTADSSLCRAAAHAGVVARTGGSITALREAGRDLYVGTGRNGVQSSDYGTYAWSVRFEGGPPLPQGPEPCPQRLSINPDLPMPLSCVCSPEAVRDGTVWGTDAYTSDSSLCRAALHAGALGRDGGRISVMREAGRELYAGSARNGVTSNDYSSAAASIRFAH